MYDPQEDGVTHINVYSRSRSWLGRMLSNFAHTPFDHPDHGHFESVEGYWHWFATGMQRDELRTLWGWKALKIGHLVDKVEMNSAEFASGIKAALRCKLLQNSDILVALLENTLPLTHYYAYGNPTNYKVVVPKGSGLLISLIEELRSEFIKTKAVKFACGICWEEVDFDSSVFDPVSGKRICRTHEEAISILSHSSPSAP